MIGLLGRKRQVDTWGLLEGKRETLKKLWPVKVMMPATHHSHTRMHLPRSTKTHTLQAL